MSKVNSQIRVLNLSTHNENCGIGRYQEDFVRSLKDNMEITSDFYSTSPNVIKKMDSDKLSIELSIFKDTLSKYDILHIQHEFGFFSGDGEGLKRFVDIAKELDKKIIITIHTAPSLIYRPITRGSNSLRGWLGYYRRQLKNDKILRKRLFPFRDANVVFTLNSNTTKEMITIVGLNRSQLVQTKIPVEAHTIDSSQLTTLRRQANFATSDIVLACVGFLTEKKGVDAAIKSLSFLPSKYKLAILGGVNPEGGDSSFYDVLCDLVVDNNLQDRVYISGYIPDDDELDILVSGADIGLYPYDLNYYRLASSAAVNTSINNNIAVIAYPTESFKEINDDISGTIKLTSSANYYELAREIISLDTQTQLKNAAKYAQKNSLESLTNELAEVYKSLIL